MFRAFDRFFASRFVQWGGGLTFLYGAIRFTIAVVGDSSITTVGFVALILGSLSLVVILVLHLRPSASREVQRTPVEAESDVRPARDQAVAERIQSLADDLMAFSSERARSAPRLAPGEDWLQQRQAEEAHRIETKAQFDHRFSNRIATAISAAERAGVGVEPDFKQTYSMLAGPNPIQGVAVKLIDIASHLR